MKKIALATCPEYPDLTAEDRLLARCLRELGFVVAPFVWSEPQQNAADYSAFVIRSCWDYHKNPYEFLIWIGQIEKTGAMIFNPPEILRWNINKKYLRELKKNGVMIPPTLWFEQGEHAKLAEILAACDWQRAIIKPAISATAWKTFVVTRENARELQAEFEDLLATNDILLQKFVAEIQTKGEWSLIFIDNKFSHAVLKQAKTGDFRVQSNFGGTLQAGAKPTRALIAEAQRILENIKVNLIYARVDVVEIAGEICLMELELIEPVLFLENNLLAARRFAAAIAEKLESHKNPGKYVNT